MTKKKQVFLLFSLPLLIPLLVMLIRAKQNSQTVTVNSGGYASDAAGERHSLLVLSKALEHHPLPGIVATTYSVSERKPPRHTWLYVLQYDRQDQTLSKQTHSPYQKSRENPLRLERWINVKEEDIHQLTAPVGRLKTVQEIAAYHGGNIKDLEQLGAKRQVVP